MDPNHDILVGPVGIWVPWDPEAYKTGKVEYLEEELNALMNEKQKNENTAKNEFEKRVKDAKKKAMEDNINKAKESGNVLTQTMNKEGELVNVKDLNQKENTFLKEEGLATTSEIKDVLFNSDDVVTDKNTDHGYSNLSLVKESQK